jgi:hypothetical protein
MALAKVIEHPQAVKSTGITIGAKVTTDRVPQAAHKKYCPTTPANWRQPWPFWPHRQPRRKYLIRSPASTKIS